jgi:hypothetical protein
LKEHPIEEICLITTGMRNNSLFKVKDETHAHLSNQEFINKLVMSREQNKKEFERNGGRNRQ